ncbi:Acyl-CoA dehydrogenase, N-terminal domain [Paenibacillus sp. yr247]|uniref:acyl-CoA dehydrogenase family protein n=1 Tax=Paenibacillus sp. yr247 TaxID=1761880 RepID=UPI00087E6BD5|nr:acyl-CoA dehydrogenase family protein [Paenibacillus sp. yr247]SDO40344.1 Acyl-CoA dehydrogenase, N-terminal domain [Paenibacillus sp. yr247]
MNDAAFQNLKEEVNSYVNGRLRELSERIEETGECGLDIWAELRERGYLRLAAPIEYGGYGLSFTQYLQLLELFSQSHGSLRMVVHVINGIWRPIDFLANFEQKERFVKPLVRGEITAAFALTEPNAGSGADIQTSARKQGDEYILNGEKWLITFGDTADYLMLYARMEGTRGYEGTMALLVPRLAEGVEIEAMPPTLGLTGTGHARIILKDARVPTANLLGEVGQGLAGALNGFLDPSRVCVGMTCVGLAQRAFDLAIERSRERMTFGKPLSQRQVVQTWIAEMATDIEAARQLVTFAGRLKDENALTPPPASMAKLYALEMLQRVTDKAQQIWGGIGYFKGNEIERIYRDARAQKFEEGTAEIQKAVIAKHILAGE